MRLAIAAAILLSLAGFAHAQGGGINLISPDKPKDPIAEEKKEQIDRAYRAATQGKTQAKVANDPWGDVRAAEQPEPKAKPKPKVQAQSKPKTQ